MRTISALFFFVLAGCAASSGATQTESGAKPHEAPLEGPVPPPSDSPPTADTPSTPPSDSAAPPTTLASVGDASCTFDIAYTTEASSYTLHITKRDTHDGSCNEQKGTSTLLASSYEKPVAFAAVDARAKYLVVAFDGRYDATSAIYTRLVQIDWTTGLHLHEGEMAVGDASPFPVPAVLRPRAVSISGRDVILTVDGALPGAGDGASFVATYSDFLDVDPQQPSPAASASPTDPAE
ncbi:MAG TPA: hypothetical protein VIF62_24610 [Labilithrix sp.]